MHQFATDREALDFLAGRIAAEAKQEDVPLSDVERKILYFSETSWTLPEMASVSASFDQNCDQDEYERKIARLIARITAEHHGHNEEEEEKWDAAVVKLSEGDHYIQVLLDAASKADPPKSGFLPTLDPPAVRPPYDRLKLWLTAFGIVVGPVVLTALLNRLFGPRFWSVADWVFGDRNRLGLIVLFVLFAWWLGPRLKGALGILRNRR